MDSKLDYQAALMNASKGMIRVKDPVTLLKIITRFVDRQIGVTHVGILLFDRVRGAYVLIDSKGEVNAKMPIGYVRVASENPLVTYFKAPPTGAFVRKEALVFSELEHMRKVDDIKKTMTYLRASICVPSFYKKELIGILILGEKLSGELYFEPEINLFVTLANDVAMAVKNAELIKDLKTSFEKEKQLFIQTSIALATAIDARDRYTHGHSERVSHYSLVIAKQMMDSGMAVYDREFMETVQLSALLHDVGKIGIRDQILNKPAALTDEEFEVMKTHVTIGDNIVKPIHGLSHLSDGILYHHERWDGKGYPKGLKGEEIPLIGRIVTVADSYDTITTARAYKKAMTPEEAFTELKKCSGSQFDPKIVEMFLEARKRGKISKREYTSFDFSRVH